MSTPGWFVLSAENGHLAGGRGMKERGKQIICERNAETEEDVSALC